MSVVTATSCKTKIGQNDDCSQQFGGLYSDTVNTASRMESNGERDRYVYFPNVYSSFAVYCSNVPYFVFTIEFT